MPAPICAQPFVKAPSENDDRILRSRYMGVDRQFIKDATTYTQCELRVTKKEKTDHKLIQDIEVEIERKLIRIIDPKRELGWLQNTLDVVFTEKCSGTFNISNGLVILSAYTLETSGRIKIPWALQNYRLVSDIHGNSLVGVLSQQDWTQGVLELSAF